MLRGGPARDGAPFAGIQVSGHSGHAEQGHDIVCAAVTGAVRLTECILNDVMGAGARTEAEPRAARVRIELPDGGSRAEGAQAVLAGFARYAEQLALEYPGHVSVLYEAANLN